MPQSSTRYRTALQPAFLARGGKREAVLELAGMVVTEIDPELAGWLAQLGTEEATGRHQVGER